MAFFQSASQVDKTTIKKISFVNHTECECRQIETWTTPSQSVPIAPTKKP